MTTERRQPPAEISQVLSAWTQGDAVARDRLVSIVDDELRGLAHHYMRGERDGHVLETTAFLPAYLPF